MIITLNSKTKVISSTKSWIWNGQTRLEGELILTPCCLHFQSKDFPNSHINFKIELENVKSVRSFLLFNIERKGLHIQTKDEKSEYFILENVKEFQKQLELAMVGK